MKKLIIVESPSKAKTIKNFLGKTYEVIASKGHIRDLPQHAMGIKYDGEQFTPKYEIDKSKRQTVDELKAKAASAESVLIATDEDREGEAIGYHIAQILGKDLSSYPRIVFHEVTKEAITASLKNPRTIDLDKVNAQQARRLLDRLVGYNLSPLLGSKIQKGLSAGRVQSSSLKIIVDREREIQAFKPQEFWTISAVFNGSVEAVLESFNGKALEKLSINSGERADEIYKILKKESFSVGEIETKTRKVSPQPPFMTSSLQQAASSVLGFSPKRTMQIAQELYEGVKTPKGEMGLITYMRTDSLNINAAANKKAREQIKARFGAEFLNKTTRIYKSKSKGAQEAHEAIRPTDTDLAPDVLGGYLSAEQKKLYTLIYNRFLASQMSDAVFQTQNIFFVSPSGTFKASGRKLEFAGFYKLTGDDGKDKLLPDLKKGASAKLTKLEKKQSFTEPPARYSEAGLIKTLESLGIGRPSTYAPTISTLQARGYIEIAKKQITPQKIAFSVTDMLERHFCEIVDSSFTAKLEEDLDKIEDEKKDWQAILKDFYDPFLAKIKDAKVNVASQKTVKQTDELCPLCGAPLVIRNGRFGEFISCSGYPKCKYTKNIAQENEDLLADLTCERCGKPMVIKNGKRGKFYACSGYPACKNTKSLTPPKTIETPCPKCGKTLVERSSKRGKFYGCTGYPACDFLSKYPLVQKPCPLCGYAMALKELKTKTTLECLSCKHKEDLKAKPAKA
ncbi:MAG: type I DNA topoisomerase [Helicobacteraceae bacterium]